MFGKRGLRGEDSEESEDGRARILGGKMMSSSLRDI